MVADSADESTYLPALVAAGYALRVREPNWHEHRNWTYTQSYADAKTAVVKEIMSRARRADKRCASEAQ